MLKGQGTKFAPYQIETAAELEEIRDNLAACYSLEADLTLEGEFSPIGSQFEPFTGVLEGNGYQIRNLFMRHTTQYAGLFAWNEGEIRNVVLENANVRATGAVGAVAGYNDGVIENCTVSGEVRGTTWVGALAGKIGKQGKNQGTSTAKVFKTAWPEANGEELVIFVSPDGSDENDGTEASPLATLQKVRDKVRTYIEEGCTKNIIVYLRGGDYLFSEPFQLNEKDSFHNGQTVTYRNYPGEKVRCIGGRKVSNWEECENGCLRSQVGGKPSRRLLVNGVLKRPAAVSDWVDYPNADLTNVYAYFTHGWFSEDLKVTGVDTRSQKISTALVPSKFSGEVRYVYGSLDFLKNPGDWSWGADGRLYYMPVENDPLDIWVPMVSCIFRLEGSTEETPVENIRIEGLELLLTDAGENFTAQGGRGKEGFEDEENTLAAVWGKNIRGCMVSGCYIHNCSLNGVAVQGKSSCCMVENNRMQNLGYAGVHLNGSWIDSDQYISYHHRVWNNEISDVGLFTVHGAGIYILGSGHNHVCHNLVYNAPRYGISIKGSRYHCWPTDCGINQDGSIPFERHWDYLHSRNNLIEANEVHEVGRNSLDGGGIEAWGPGRDNVADYNLVYDFYNGQPTINWKGHGIFLDDATHYFRVTNNIVYESKKQGADASTFMKSIGIQVRNNIFDVTNTHQGAANISPYLDPCWEQSFVGNIVYADPKGGIGEDGQFIEGGSRNRRMYTYDQTAAVGWDKPVIRELDYNLYWNTCGECVVSTNNSDPSVDMPISEFAKKMGFDANSLIADPLFVDAPNRNYALKKNSPAFKLGFKSIDQSRCGLMDVQSSYE